ncbi:ATP-binding cassette domain-containing protein [Paenibacillus sp. GCM10027626]|uniref:ATP-binding cassette domain-containing protein n=1 Tax=Paenibacillus sp. GCM10027626 TaxID=3273411 RepID=UPI0036342B39
MNKPNSLTINMLPGTTRKLELHQGTITVLLGANGAGKSRLMEIAAGLRSPDGLAVGYGAEPLWQTGRRKPRVNEAALRAYSYAGQSPEEQLFARSVAAELEYVLHPYGLSEEEQQERIDEALAAVGWDRGWLQRDPYQMSGGERRRAAIACLLAVPAAWLLLDEPTAGLDAAGHELLAAALRRSRQHGQGILLISHESDWALPLADQVLVMATSGEIMRTTSEELLADPAIFTRAGMLVPEWLEIAHMLWQRGAPEALIWKPKALAEAQVEIGGEQPDNAHESCRSRGGGKPDHGAARATDGTGPATGPGSESGSKPVRRSVVPVNPPSPIASFDPRAIWLAYILLSAGILVQQTWAGVAWGAVLTAAVIVIARVPLRPWRIPIAMLTLFTILLSIFAGLGAGGGGSWWGMEAFLRSLHGLVRPLLAMLIGLGLPLAITPLRLRRSLEQLLSVRGRVPLWAQKCILAVTLLLRFIPVLLEQWGKFSRIALARGKVARLTFRGAIGRVKDTSIPFLLAMFRMGEEVAAALESRGVGKRNYPIINAVKQWRWRDTWLVGCFIILFAFLWWWRQLL